MPTSKYDIHQMLTVESNTELFFPDYFRTERLDPFLPRITIKVTPRIEEHIKGSRIAVSYSYSADDDALLMKSSWFPRARLKVGGLSTERIEISATPWFQRLTRVGWRQYQLHELVRAILASTLLQRRKLLLHSACVKLHDRGILIPAYYSTGKTTTSLRLVKSNAEGRYLADDHTIISDSEAYSFPSDCLIGLAAARTIGIPLRGSSYLNLVLRTYISKLLSAHVIKPEVSMAVHSLLPRSSIERRTRLTHIFFLQLGPQQILDLDRDDAIRTLLHFNRYAMGFYYHPLLQIYDYFNPKFNLSELIDQEKLIVSRLVDSVEKCHLIVSPSPEHYAVEIMKLLVLGDSHPPIGNELSPP